MPWMNNSNRSAIAGLLGLPLGQRADARRIVDHEDRAHQGVFDLLLEHEALDHVGVLADRVEAELLGQLGDARRVVGPQAGVLGEQLVVGLAGERRREVDLPCRPRAASSAWPVARIASTIIASVRSIIVS